LLNFKNQNKPVFLLFILKKLENMNKENNTVLRGLYITKNEEIIASFTVIFSIKRLGKRYLIHGIDEGIYKPKKIKLIALDSVEYDTTKVWKANMYLTAKNVGIEYTKCSDFERFETCKE
jgi:hypothetical protein